MLRPSMRTGLLGIAGELASLERMILGRTRPEARGAVREALALCGLDHWCRGCGKTLAGARPAPDSREAGLHPLCRGCLVRPLFDGFVRLGRYAAPLDRLVQRVKARAWHDVAEALGKELARVLDREFPISAANLLVAPIPSPALRRWRRGIDHTDAMARGLCAESRIERVRWLRAPPAARQAALRREERLRRARLAWCGPKRVPEGSCVVLVDDIRTTGATLFKARELFEFHGARRVIPAVVCVRDDSQAIDLK